MLRLNHILKKNNIYIITAIGIFFHLILVAAYSQPKKSSIENGSSVRPLSCTYPSAPFSQERTDQMLIQMENYLINIGERLQEIPRDSFDPAFILDTIGDDPLTLFHWVKSNTFLLPYRGSLRGPIGVLMDRQGNSLDRALLLCELLNLAGHEVRLAQGFLPERKAVEILAKIQTNRQDSLSPAEQLSKPEMEELIERGVERYQLDESETRKTLEKLNSGIKELTAKLEKKVLEQSTDLADKVEKHREKQNFELSREKIKDLQDHWWVQLKKEGSWLDLDPLLPESEAGKSTVQAENHWEPEDLEEEYFHLVDIQLIIERWDEKGLVQETVLEHTFKPQELLGERVVLQHYPLDWPSEQLEDSKRQDTFQKQKQNILETTEWIPVLKVGDEEIMKFSIRNSGEINQTPGEEEKAEKGGGPLGGLANVFGGGGKKQKESKKSVLTAEWVEYKIRCPGKRPQVIQRTVFDIIGPAQREKIQESAFQIDEEMLFRRNLKLFFSGTEILFQFCQFSPEFFVHHLAEGLIKNKDFMADLIKHNQADRINQIQGEKEDQIFPLTSPLYIFAMSRFSFSRFQNNFLDQTNISNYTVSPHMNRDGNLVFELSLDIVANECSILPSEGIDPFSASIEQGVLDTIAETMALGSFGDILQNTSEIFSRSQIQNIDWVAIKNPDDPTWMKISLPEDAKTCIKKALDEGYVVVAPIRPIEAGGRALSGWWQVNPLSGATLGIMENGAGQALVKYAITVLKKGAPFWLMIGCEAADFHQGICDPCTIFWFSLLWTGGKLIKAMLTWVEGETAVIALGKIFLFKGPAWLSLLMNLMNLFALVHTVDPCLKGGS